MRKPHIEIYQSPTCGQWFWRLRAGNGERIADGCEGYSSASNAERAVNRFLELAKIAVDPGSLSISIRDYVGGWHD